MVESPACKEWFSIQISSSQYYDTSIPTNPQQGMISCNQNGAARSLAWSAQAEEQHSEGRDIDDPNRGVEVEKKNGSSPRFKLFIEKLDSHLEKKRQT